MNSKVVLVILFVIKVVNCGLIERVVACGQRNGSIGTIFGGAETQKGEWPWLVPFYHRPTNNFFCAGTLISEKHVLSGKELFVSLCSFLRLLLDYSGSLFSI